MSNAPHVVARMALCALVGSLAPSSSIGVLAGQNGNGRATVTVGEETFTAAALASFPEEQMAVRDGS